VNRYLLTFAQHGAATWESVVVQAPDHIVALSAITAFMAEAVKNPPPELLPHGVPRLFVSIAVWEGEAPPETGVLNVVDKGVSVPPPYRPAPGHPACIARRRSC